MEPREGFGAQILLLLAAEALDFAGCRLGFRRQDAVGRLSAGGCR
jgi:hypothetical protein